MDVNIQQYGAGFAYLAVFLVTVIIAKVLYNLTTPNSTFNALSEHNNVALGFTISGFIFANGIIFCCVMMGPSAGLWADMQNVALFNGLGLLLLVLSRLINDKIILANLCLRTAVFEQKNQAVGITQGSIYVASGLIIGAAIIGDGSLLTALVFYALGQLAFILMFFVYQRVTKFDLRAELESGNTAVATSYALTNIAVGLILFHAIAGDFVDWPTSLTYFAVDTVLALFLLPLARFSIDKFIFPNVCLDQQIKSGNLALALVEGLVLTTLAAAIVVSF